MKNFGLDLREHATKIFTYVKKDLVLMIAIKSTIKFEIIANILGNIEVLLMISAT